MTERRRQVLYVTGTRADFGLMRSTLAQIDAHPGLSLSLAVTGMHLSTAHGHTVDEVRASGLPIAAELPVDMATRSPASMAEGIGHMLVGLTGLMARQRPDLLLLLGDRGEMLAAAIAALHLGVPSLHLHGGERSGTVDEPVRHAISKLCSYHGVATPGSRQRLIGLGEAPERIFVTGAPGLDGLQALAATDRTELLAALGLPAEPGFVLVLFHPVVQQAAQAETQARELLAAVQGLGRPVLWLAPNADAGSLGVLQALDGAALPPGSRRVTHLARPLFCAALRHCAALLGNSSSGIIEAASFGTPVVNVGDRQRLRERNPLVADVPVAAEAVLRALQAAVAAPRGDGHNVYGDGQAGARITALLASLPLDAGLLEKANTF